MSNTFDIWYLSKKCFFYWRLPWFKYKSVCLTFPLSHKLFFLKSFFLIFFGHFLKLSKMFPQYSLMNLLSFISSFVLTSFSFIYVALLLTMLTAMVDHMILKINVKMTDVSLKKNIYIYRKLQNALNLPLLEFISYG